MNKEVLQQAQTARKALVASDDLTVAYLAGYHAGKPANDMEVVGYQYQRLTPEGSPEVGGVILAWSEVVPMADRTALEKVDELSAYRYQGKPVYRVRAVYVKKETI